MTIIGVISAASAAFGAQSLSFNDNDGEPTAGTYNPNDVFSIDVFLTYRHYKAFGLSYWLEVQKALAPYISITDVTYFKFLDPNQLAPNPAFFNSRTGARNRYRTETRDLGATGMLTAPGTYKITHIEFTLNGAVPGTYLMKSTITSPHGSIVTKRDFTDQILPTSTYTITIAPNTIASTDAMMIVPEPTTFTLMALGAAAMAWAAYRRRCSR